MKVGYVLGAVVAILLGAFLFVYGGYDDSPGAQLLGVVVAALGIVGIVRSRKKRVDGADS